MTSSKPRSAPLKRTGTVTLRAVVGRARRPPEPGEVDWKRPRPTGICAVCKRQGPVILHHLVDKNLLKRILTPEQRAAGLLWDQRNALMIGAPMPWGGKCRCHDRHTNPGSRADDRLDFKHVTAAAQQFAIEVLGEGPAINYWRRNYRNAP
jgi:hypothetical protein